MERLEQDSLQKPGFVRIRLDLRYLGTEFHGWAIQPGLRTVQGELEEALRTILRTEVSLTVAGRTDAGVHAAAQVAHFDVEAHRISRLHRQPDFNLGLRDLLTRVNSLLARNSSTLGADVVLVRAKEVCPQFDARFSALQRHYLYRISDSLQTNDPLRAHNTWWVLKPLDVPRMRDGAKAIVGEHDFLSFCKPREGATTIRTVNKVEVRRVDAGVEVALSADAFCHSMVRTVVGALEQVGRGSREPNWIDLLLQSPSRAHSVPIAPAHGLTLMAVDYPQESQWSAQQDRTRRVRSLQVEQPPSSV